VGHAPVGQRTGRSRQGYSVRHPYGSAIDLAPTIIGVGGIGRLDVAGAASGRSRLAASNRRRRSNDADLGVAYQMGKGFVVGPLKKNKIDIQPVRRPPPNDSGTVICARRCQNGRGMPMSHQSSGSMCRRRGRAGKPKVRTIISLVASDAHHA